jgi:glycosyltransferase involved in cell wall biosynthesis
MPRNLGISWPLSSISGYGVYGTQLALSHVKGGASQVMLFQAPLALTLGPLEQRLLGPALAGAAKLEALLSGSGGERLDCPHAVLHGVGNDFATHEVSDRLKGTPDIGCIAFESTRFSPEGLEKGRRFDALIAISAWNAERLKGLGFKDVRLFHQGIDASLFHPAPSSQLLPGRFVVFSGGKLEYRKGQDIAVAAFRRFQARHPEAILLASWQTPNPDDSLPFALAGHVEGVLAKDGRGGLEIASWLAANGLPPGSFHDLGWVPHPLLAPVLREAHLAIFPNRCEGGTNLVAMECIACAVPTILAANTGQLDLIEQTGCRGLAKQGPVRSPHPLLGVEGWGESDVEELDAAMEAVFSSYASERAKAEQAARRIALWNWDDQNRPLLDSLY